MVVGVLLTIVTVALAGPPGPAAVTVATPEAGQTDGAVYWPLPVTVPEVADQPVAPAEVNCCVVPRSRVAVVGEMTCAGMGTSVTAALAEPPGPTAVTVTVVEEGKDDGAVYKPEEEMVPAVAVQLVAPAEVNCWVFPMITEAEVGDITCGASGTSVTFALAEPPGPTAVTVTAVDEGMAEGAVYKPVGETVPAVAVQLVAPAEVNCLVCPGVTEADVGEIDCGSSGASVTFALAAPPGPVAVTVTAVEEGIVEGAVYKPVDDTVPAVAVQVVAPADVNCFVCPSLTVAEVGEMACGMTNVTVNAGPQRVPGLMT